MAWSASNLAFIGSLTILLAALYFGPLPIVVRGAIRSTVGQSYIGPWQSVAFCGVSIGMVLFVISMGLRDLGGPIDAVLLCLLLMLAMIDWQWRWLPIEWTLGVIALALLQALPTSNYSEALLQMLIPAGALLFFRSVASSILKREALGAGDVWLIAGLGGFLPVFGTFALMGFAAFSGLLEVLVRRLLRQDERKTTSVSYGTHLCFVFLILTSLPQDFLT